MKENMSLLTVMQINTQTCSIIPSNNKQNYRDISKIPEHTQTSTTNEHHYNYYIPIW